jgi:D-glycero-D-manno-heptose 1,7-bisphosphate phosphatase
VNKAVFLDRDGTVIIDKHYLSDPNDIEFLPGAISALTIFKEKDFLIYLITNQSGIGRGFFTEKEMHLVHAKLEQLLKEQDIHLKGIGFCPHSPEDNCDCRKPHPKLINEFVNKDHIDPKLSYMVGDKQSDVEAGHNAHMQGILLTEQPGQENEFKTLLDFAQSL